MVKVSDFVSEYKAVADPSKQEKSPELGHCDWSVTGGWSAPVKVSLSGCT